MKIEQQRCVRFVDNNKPDKIRCSAPKYYNLVKPDSVDRPVRVDLIEKN